MSYKKGEILRTQGLFKPAIKQYLLVLKSEKVLENRLDLMLSLASCYRTLGDAQKSLELVEKVRKISQELELDDYLILALQEKAMSLRAGGKLEDSLKILNQLLKFYTNIKDADGLSYINWAIGGVYRLQGEFKKSIKHFNSAINNAQDKITLGYAYCGLAGVSRIAGDIEGCIKNYKIAGKLFAKTNDNFGKAYINCGLANGLRQKGDYKTAFKHYLVADKLYSKIDDKADLGFVKWGKAFILMKQSKIKQAFNELKLAEKLFSKTDEVRGQLLTQLSLANCLYILGDVKKADKIYDNAIKKARKENLYTYLETFT